MAKKPAKPVTTTIPKGKRKGKYAPTKRSAVGGKLVTNPLDRYKPK